MNTYDNEIPKRIKKKESRVSKAKKKSKHKHQYAECLIRYKNQDYIHDKEWMVTELKTYCTICGKVYDKAKNSIVTDYMTPVYTSLGRYYHILSSEELYDRYHDKMPVFYKDDDYNGYINLEDLEK